MASTNPLIKKAPEQGGTPTTSFPAIRYSHILFLHGEARLHFVVSTGVDKLDPGLRKTIRSHVMIGKNRGKTRPTRKRESNRRQDRPCLNEDASPAKGLEPERELVKAPAFSSMAHHADIPATVPRKLGSEVSTLHFADALEPGVIEVVLQCKVLSVSRICNANS